MREREKKRAKGAQRRNRRDALAELVEAAEDVAAEDYSRRRSHVCVWVCVWVCERENVVALGRIGGRERTDAGVEMGCGAFGRPNKSPLSAKLAVADQYFWAFLLL